MTTVFRGPPAASEPGIGSLALPGLLADVVERYGDLPALAFPRADGTLRITYTELGAEAHRVAGALLAAGVGKGSRVAALVGNRPEWVAAAFGATIAGAVFVPLNTWFEPPELDHVLRHCDASVLFVQEELAGRRYLDELTLNRPDLYPYLRDVVRVGPGPDRPGIVPWAGFIADGCSPLVVAAAEAQVTPSDDALIIYTSGSTALPKGVLHGHAAPAIQSWRFAQHLGVSTETRVWSAFPLFWTAGLAMVMGGTLAGGGCLLLEERFDPGEALRLIAAEQVTMAHAWPHQLAALEDHPDWPSADLSSLRHVERFGPFGRHPSVGPLPDWTARAAYGSTETFTIVSSDPAATAWRDGDTHSGHILPGNSIRIVDPATGEEQPVDGDGEIHVKGPTLMKGYVKVGPGVDEDGWFHTGDAGFVDGEGRLHWTGRTSDLIKTGGANVSPVEVEEALARYAPLKGAFVVGVPDDLLGELVVVCAVRHEAASIDEEAVREFLRGKVASYKIPRRVLFLTDADLELTANAKVRTEALRSLAAVRLKASRAGE